MEKERQPRYSCKSLIRIDSYEGQALLRNVSLQGFCVESKTYASLDQDKEYIIFITPEVDMPEIKLEVKVKWSKSTEHNFMFGCLITKNNPYYEKYINRIKIKNPLIK